MLNKQDFVDRLAPCERTLYCVARSILKQDADCADAVQEAILRAWTARGSFRTDNDFRPWITRILINECRNIQRRRMKALPVADVLPTETADDHAELNEALASLPEKLRLAVTLHYLEGFQVDEIGKILNLPSGTVKWRLNQARGKLRQMLEKEGVQTI